jgi:hypothetical protein
MDLSELAARAYVYGFPLVFDLEQVQRFVTTGLGSTPPTPYNQLSHARTLASAADTFVSINNDTLYSIAQLDLGVGPLELSVPDSEGRYYVLQFVDAWTNNFAYVGHRATGTGAGTFWLLPPGDDRAVPDGVTPIHVPTRVATIVGRWACDGRADLPAVHRLQDAMRLTPLDPDAVAVGVPEPDGTLPPELLFLDQVRLWSQEFPPAPRDLELQAQLAPTGITDPTSPYASLDAEQAAQLVAGVQQGKALLEDLVKGGAGSAKQNGWQLTYHVFDYNLDYFEVGTLDDPAYQITDPQIRIGTRAGAALAGLWGNHAYEAAYVMSYVDSDGQQLNGAHTYTLRLSPVPPVGAFWSITMYDVPDFFLVDNPIDRYSIGDRTPGLVVADDGSVTITISREEPTDPTARANWLPAPAGDFRPILRMYEPDPSVLEGRYAVPPFVRTDP